MKTFAIASTTVLLALLQTTSRVSAAQCGAILNNINYPGNDLQAIANVATAEACCAQCSSTNGCNAFTWSQWNGGTCFLKTHVSAPMANDPAPDGSAYMRSGVAYKCPALMEDTDFANIDLSNTPSQTAEGCCGICRNTNGCTKFSWSGYNGGTCWLKTGANQSKAYVPGVKCAPAY